MSTPTGEESKDHLEEFANQKPAPKKTNPVLGVIIGLFFIGYGIFRLTTATAHDGNWNTIFGWIMIALGTIRILLIAAGKV
jgi:uncharacterized membrane protein HdeD (DUF308 family)